MTLTYHVAAIVSDEAVSMTEERGDVVVAAMLQLMMPHAVLISRASLLMTSTLC
jgi:hypothetical protein